MPAPAAVLASLAMPSTIPIHAGAGRAAAMLAVLAALAVPPAAAQSTPVDQGSFKIYVGNRALGTEVFSYATMRDSIVIGSQTRVVSPTASGDTLIKDMALIVKADFDLKAYRSQASIGQDAKLCGIVVQDTALTIFRQHNQAGDAITILRPPGKIYVIDPFIYTMFDVIGRELHGRTFERRTIQLLILSERDSVIDAVVTRLPKETIPWGGKPVTAEKFEIGDGQVTFQVWMSPAGHMIKLAEANTGLRVERDPPPVKRRKRS
jgi:hypothetical protein